MRNKANLRILASRATNSGGGHTPRCHLIGWYLVMGEKLELPRWGRINLIGEPRGRTAGLGTRYGSRFLLSHAFRRKNP
jgi:hypothetical protein